MPPSKQEEAPTPLRGMDAYQAAMRDPSLLIFRRDWRGRLELLDRAEATRQALLDDPRPLYAEQVQ